jgi:hypothetical protein
MLSNRTIEQIRAAWQADIEAHLEAGQTPALHLGLNREILEGAPGLLALQTLAERRDDITAPVIMAGGTSPLWPAALLHGRPADRPPRSPDIYPIYAGADVATWLASHTLYADGYSPLRRHAFLRPPAGLPPAMTPLLAPTNEPGAAVAWEALPFHVVAQAERDQRRRAGAPTETPAADHAPDWTAYAAVMLAVLLVLAAIILSLQP